MRTQLWQEADTRSEAAFSTLPVVAMSPEDEQEQLWVNSNSDPLERITSPHPIVKSEIASAPQTPQPVAPYENMVEQAVSRLNEAAQRIEQVDQAQHGSRRGVRVPRASRLAPLPDISSEIRRESTPMPSVLQSQQSEPVGDLEDLGQRMPDLWPWLQDADQDENDNDNWANHTDPLMARHFPNSAEIARIEEEDMRRAIAEGAVTMSLLPGSKKKKTHQIRLVFAVLATLALIALIADSSLIAFVLLHSHRGTPVVNGVPTLTLSSNEASLGQTILLHINHFSPNTHVFITHDIEIPVQLTSGTAIVNTGASGSTSVSMLVDNSWGPGFHTIDAEDSLTRYTASATLQIGGSGPTPPSHLELSTNSIDLGQDIVGANTLQQLKLQNSGGGSITWSASTNQPWLLLSPTTGAFSTNQTIEIAGERANLKPGEYSGTITISSNVGAAQQIKVSMNVEPLPFNMPVLQVTPALLSFTALDGGANPNAQLLMISNPGSQPLHWSLASNTSFMLASQILLMQSQDASTAWLSTDQASGTVEPHGTMYIQVYAQSRNLLPGVYTDTLSFNGNGAADKAQSVSASLTVQPNCGLVLSTGYMSFTGVSGQGNPSNGSLNLSITPSCSGTVSWNAVSYASWLTNTPASGQLQGNNHTVTAVSVNMTNLKPGTYTSSIAFSSKQSTQTLMVQLIVQPPPSPTTPIMAASPLNLSFSTTQGMPNPPGQVVTISNTGGGALFWNTQVQGLASTWLWATPKGGTIAPNQTAPLTIGVDTSTLTPNTYVGQVILNGTDKNNKVAPGSPQTIMVTLVVLPACTLAQPSSSSLAFNAIAGGTNPSPQTETITVSGNCAWPVTWQAQTVGSSSWLTLSPTSGVLTASGQSATLTVSVNIAGLAPANYNATVAISAIDSGNVPAQGSPQTFAVALTVLPPCTLQLSNTNFAFSVGQGQPAPTPQTLSFSENGSCARPVNWTAAGDPNSSAWLSLSPTSGSDNGSGASISVGISSTNMNLGTYTGSITLTATDSNGAPVQGSPQTITVTLTITGFSISGTVMACTSNPCTSSNPLPGATLILTANSSGTRLGIAVADGSGNYAFNDNIPSGSYTITASGTVGSTIYNGNISINVMGNLTNVIVDVYPV
ncbi:MAG: BACON domain-containing protein [Ktedonobacteraceae bacterium]